MQEGKLITHAPQHEIIKQAEGRIFEVLLDNGAINTFKHQYKIIGTARQADKFRVRYISTEDTVAPSSIQVTATLEDAYLFLTQNKA